VLVVVLAVDAEDVLEVAAAEDEDPVEAVGAERAHPAFGVGVRVRRLDRRADHLDPLAAEDVVEGAAELRVAVMDEKPEQPLVAELHDEVARLLGDPATVRIGGARDVLDPPNWHSRDGRRPGCDTATQYVRILAGTKQQRGGVRLGVVGCRTPLPYRKAD
jgi:hypothetical protein